MTLRAVGVEDPISISNSAKSLLFVESSLENAQPVYSGNRGGSAKRRRLRREAKLPIRKSGAVRPQEDVTYVGGLCLLLLLLSIFNLGF